MKRIFSFLLIFVLVFSSFPSQLFGGIFSSQNAKANSEVPFFDGVNYLEIPQLIPGEGNEYVRVDKKGLSGVQYLGDFRYATIYEGKLSGSPSSDNTVFNANGKSTRAYAGDKWYHVVPKGGGTARNIIRIEDLTSTEFVQRYGGSLENYEQLRTYSVRDAKLNRYGDFYYIGNVVKMAGGYAENTGPSFDSTNPTRLRILKTVYPQITSFISSANFIDVGKAVTFDLTAYEYNYNGSKLDYNITVTDETGKKVGGINKSVNSTKNATGGLATQDRGHTGKFDGKNVFSYTPVQPGTYTAKVQVTDEVLRTSNTITKTFIARQTGEPFLEVTPDTRSIKVGDKTTYQAFYTDKTGKQTEVTNLASWKAVKTNIAAVGAKGEFTGLAEGTTEVEAVYEGLKGKANLIVGTTTPPPPPPPENPNEPPTVELIVPEEVSVGENFCAVANAFDIDGTIEDYAWGYGGVGFPTGKRPCDLYYEEEGEETILVTVTDDDGETATDEKIIRVVKPKPTAYFKAEGTFKENRKMSLKAAHPYNNNERAMQMYPITKQTWKIETVDPSKQNLLKIVQNISGNVPHTQVIDMLLKTVGEIKVTRYIENSIGDSATYTTTINVIEDKKPVADFETAQTIYREMENNVATATIEMKDNSYSLDDEIQKRVWRIAYDSNNDGKFDDEQFTVINDGNLETTKYVTNKVGKYLIELEVFEKYIHETIPQFVDLTFNKATTDLRFANTDSKTVSTKIVEVDNLEPVVTIGAKEPIKNVSVQYDLVNSPYSEAQLKALTPFLNNLLKGHNLEADISFSDSFISHKVMSTSGREYGTPVENRAFVIDIYGDVYTMKSNSPINVTSQDMIATKLNLPAKAKEVLTFKSDISNGGIFNYILLENGEVYGLGKTQLGQLGFTYVDGYSTSPYIQNPVKINLPKKVKEMAVAGDNGIFLLEDNTVYVTGKTFGESSTAIRRVTNVPTGMIQKIYKHRAYNNDTTIYLMEDGTVYETDMYAGSTPNKLNIPEKIKDVSLGNRVTHFISESGSLYAKGNNEFFQLGQDFGTTNDKNGYVIPYSPTGIVKINTPKNVKEVAAAENWTHFLMEDGTVYVSGGYYRSSDTQGGGIGRTQVKDMALLALPSKAVQIVSVNSSSHYHTSIAQTDIGNLILLANGELYNTGGPNNGLKKYNLPPTLTIQQPKANTQFSQQVGSMYMATFTRDQMNADTIRNKMKKANGYYIGIAPEGSRAAVQTVISENKNKGTFINIGTTHNDTALRTALTSLANHIIETQSSNTIEIEFLLDTATGVNKATLESKINSILKTYITGNSSYSVVTKVREITNDYQFSNTKLDEKHKYVVAVKNSAYSADLEKHITATNLVNNAYFFGVGSSTNKAIIDRIVSKSMKKGAYINNTGIDAALNTVSQQILNHLDQNRGITELFITTDEEIGYLSQYSDYEKDKQFDSYWKYQHELNFFESETGLMPNRNIKLKSPYRNLDYTGRYQVAHAAQDDPLTNVMSQDLISRFTDYRKWSSEANNLRVYVHKMPSADFSFNLNTNGNLTVTSLGKDTDKASINVGFGPGLQAQSFSYRTGTGDWIDGTPPSPINLSLTYEVRNTVTDLQGKTASMIKKISRNNLPPVAQFITDKNIYEDGNTVVITNQSYDSNNDNLNAVWYMKKKDASDSTYKQFATGALTNGVGNTGWHPKINNISCEQYTGAFSCFYTIKLVVTDPHGAKSETTRNIEVVMMNLEPISCMKIPTPNYIGDTITIKNCASDPEGQPLGISYLVEKPNGALLVYAQGDSNVLNNGDLTLTFNSHPEDLGKWIITQFVTDGFNDASSTGNLDVLNQTVKGKVLHTEQWLKNIQKYNLQYPSKAFNLDPSNGLVEFFKGERFLLETEPTRRAANIKVTIVEYPTYNTNLTLNHGDIWNGNLWAEEMYFKFKDKEELSFLFEATFENGWKATDTVKIKIRDENYWTQHTAY
ncbi:hypothetical protein MKX73_19340 [Solibacillus sp. FSL W7-1436]|uniref:hypothetical protein n=1 Tax=Solibacillus sp. FSL W7-1436 TaxID=2921705 RepID=UPI0030F8C888